MLVFPYCYYVNYSSYSTQLVSEDKQNLGMYMIPYSEKAGNIRGLYFSRMNKQMLQVRIIQLFNTTKTFEITF